MILRMIHIILTKTCQKFENIVVESSNPTGCGFVSYTLSLPVYEHTDAWIYVCLPVCEARGVCAPLCMPSTDRGTWNGRSWKICCCFRFISEFLGFFIIFSFVPLIKRDKSIAIVQVNKGKMFDNQLVEFSTRGMDDSEQSFDRCMWGLCEKNGILSTSELNFICLPSHGEPYTVGMKGARWVNVRYNVNCSDTRKTRRDLLAEIFAFDTLRGESMASKQIFAFIDFQFPPWVATYLPVLDGYYTHTSIHTDRSPGPVRQVSEKQILL